VCCLWTAESVGEDEFLGEFERRSVFKRDNRRRGSINKKIYPLTMNIFEFHQK